MMTQPAAYGVQLIGLVVFLAGLGALSGAYYGTGSVSPAIACLLVGVGLAMLIGGGRAVRRRIRERDRRRAAFPLEPR